jgi:DNA-3-methyladenine glycosylase
MRPLPLSFFEQSALELAPKLLGKVVMKGGCAGIIVETEAYGTDPASHAYKITPRSAIMRDTYGHWYVYFTYGMRYCANVTSDKDGTGAVLIRAVKPTEGIPQMKRRRNHRGEASMISLCNGPAKFCEAFGVTKRQNGLRVGEDFAIFDTPEISPDQIDTSSRIGISAGLDLPWRFYIKDNPFISRA